MPRENGAFAADLSTLTERRQPHRHGSLQPSHTSAPSPCCSPDNRVRLPRCLPVALEGSVGLHEQAFPDGIQSRPSATGTACLSAASLFAKGFGGDVNLLLWPRPRPCLEVLLSVLSLCSDQLGGSFKQMN